MSNTARIHELTTELAELETQEANSELFDSVRDTIAEVQEALGGSQEDAESVVENIEKAQEAAGDVADLIGETSEFVENASDVGSQIAEGVGDFGAKAEEVGEALGKLDGILAKVEEIRDLQQATPSEIVEGLASNLDEVIDVLEPLVGRIPGLGAFLKIYLEAIRRIAGSISIIQQIVEDRNKLSQQLLGYNIYTVPLNRRQRIEQIRQELTDLGVDLTPTIAAAPPASDVDSAAWADAQNAMTLGLRETGQTYDEAMAAASAARAARWRLERAWARLEYLEGRKLTIGAELATLENTTLHNIERHVTGDAPRAYSPQQQHNETRIDILKDEQAGLDAAITKAKAGVASALEDFDGANAAVTATGTAIFGVLERNRPDAGKATDYLEGMVPSTAVPSNIDSMRRVADEVNRSTMSAVMPTAAGGAVAAAAMGAQTDGMSSRTKRLVMIGGGGVLGMLMLGVFFILPGDSRTPGELKTAPIETESETVSEEPVETPVEEPVAEPTATDVCDLHDLGCQDMGLLPAPQMVTVNWSDTGCDVTPQSTTAEMPFAASTGGPGASIPGDDVPGNRFHFGSGMVEGRGIGGGTVTSDGVTTGSRTFYEPGTVGSSGFSGSLITEEGPANPETGELDRTQTHCTHGGAFDLQMDMTVWQGLMDGPLLEETPFWVNNFACSTRWENGFPVIYWLLGVESPIPMPASPFTVEFFVRLGSWVNVDGVPVGTTMFQNTTMTPEQIWSMDPANAGTEPPDELVEAYEEGGTWGFLDFGTASEDAYEEGGQAAEDMQNALSNFNEGDFVDLSAKVSNGGLGAFAPSSIECPWQ